MRSYSNPDQDSLIAAVVVPDKHVSYDPLVKVRKAEELKKNSDQLPFELVRSEIAPDSYVVKVDNFPLYNIFVLTEALKQQRLIDEKLQETIIKTETKLYHERMATEKGRRVYEYPQTPDTLIQAFLVQQHNGQTPFLRFKNENEQELQKACASNGLVFDRTSTEFENTAVLGLMGRTYGKDITVAQALKTLEHANVITKEFRFSVLAAEAKHTHPKSERPEYSDKTINNAQERLKMLGDLIKEHTLSAKVSHGLFMGQSARPLREIAHEFEHIKKDKNYMQQGIEKIMHIARTIGTNHPILRAATKVYALITDQENYQLVSRAELKF